MIVVYLHALYDIIIWHHQN